MKVNIRNEGGKPFEAEIESISFSYNGCLMLIDCSGLLTTVDPEEKYRIPLEILVGRHTIDPRSYFTPPYADFAIQFCSGDYLCKARSDPSKWWEDGDTIVHLSEEECGGAVTVSSRIPLTPLT